jgi:hypothetical protein
MTKLEELKTAYNDARDDTWIVACYADNALWDDAAWDAYEAAEAAEDAAWKAYQASRQAWIGNSLQQIL